MKIREGERGREVEGGGGARGERKREGGGGRGERETEKIRKKKI